MMRRNVFTTYDPNLPSGKKFVAVHVQNEDPLYFLVEVKSKVCELFTQITKFLNLFEPELFGLAIRCSDSFVFLDPLEKLSKYATKQWRTQNNGMDNDGLPLFNVYFRVQFYVDSYLFISDKVAKLLYYHQMRENVLHYEQSIGEERAFLIASYALQADYGNYNGQLHKEHYFEPSHYFPTWVIEELGVDYIVRHLPALHCDHKGMSKSEAQSMYIKEASDPIAPHNFHFYRVACKKGANTYEVWLAITVSGIAVYAADPNHSTLTGTGMSVSPNQHNKINTMGRDPKRSRLKTRISFFPWTDIGKLSFDKKKFEIRSTGTQSRKFVYYSANEEIARHLLWFSRASHQFHLMVQQKMKEMLKREAEINRRKYRESCISSTSSSTNSSSGNSSGSSNGNPSSTGSNSGNTSKSVSPFEYGSTSSGSSSTAGVVGDSDHHKNHVGISDLDISNSSVCGDDQLSNRVHHLNVSNQRISVISNASSNTTSGIVSDKMVGMEDSDRDDIDSDLLMSLNHHHHHHRHRGVNRAITLSGCSSQPVVSLESLALSEPTEHRSCRTMGITDSKSANLTANKKHSISISNIMITSTTPSSSSSSTSSSSMANTEPSTTPYSNVSTSSSSSSSCANQMPIHVTNNNSYKPTNEVMVVGDNCSKVLCLNINERNQLNHESNCCSLSPYDHHHHQCTDDESSLYDESDSVFDNTNKSYTSGKSNVTVLSTILKPEAERLLKQGIEADDGEMMIDDGIDSIELAELKEFEQAEKEKIILNSLINKMPPPPPLSSDSDDSSSSSSSEDEDDDDMNHFGTRHCYSPLSQERMMHRGKITNKEIIASRPPPLNNLKFHGHDGGFKSKMDNHIYENLKCDINRSVMPPVSPTRTNRIEALVTPQKGNSLPPPVPLRQCPSLNAFPQTYCTPINYPQRKGMKIGVSSLNRPYGNRAKLNLNPMGTCPNHHHHQSHLHANQQLISTPSNRQCCNCNPFDSSTLSSGSEPNLYFQSNNLNCWPMVGSRGLACNKSDSVFDCRLNVSTTNPTTITSTPMMADRNKPLTNLKIDQSANVSTVSQDSNNNIEKIFRPHQLSSSGDESPPSMPLTTVASSVTSQKLNRSSEANNLKLKSKESSISDLHQLRQRSSDLNLPLITALFNDSSLMDQLKVNNNNNNNNNNYHHQSYHHGEANEKMSQSLQQIPQQVARSSAHHNGATVERTNTFRVDEAIAKSTLRQHHVNNSSNDDNNNRPDYNSPTNVANRPTSWHLDNSCSGHNRLFPNGIKSSTYGSSDKPIYGSHVTKQSTPTKLYNSDFVERIWADHQLTT
ncbi:hypothetical protein RDWZM_009570 [Blomia tropicalis]|uniref:FERM domain-containing protein n=1 Tax=Blomia tropicalis TaxID=40697 RepID=A0A9Q0M4A4_BLOTA|nr:hypothetical protein RDWZM_009570 [Blomia tropicalis]